MAERHRNETRRMEDRRGSMSDFTPGEEQLIQHYRELSETVSGEATVGKQNTEGDNNMSKYTDLAEQIHAGTRDVVYLDEVGEVLSWLDSHPDQVPGRTITASEFDEAVESCITEDATVPPHKFAERLGVVCVPDPEPPESVPGRTITRSHYQNIIDETSVPYGVGFTDGFHQAGGSIIDDPEPTNLQRLSRAIRDWEQGRGADGILARHLDAIGVRMVTESE